ncbi:hypothetical protein N9Q76_00505 [Flavobacteriales bacterium]|nr:hypothetical protein [Flavobacteriales bacterium]
MKHSALQIASLPKWKSNFDVELKFLVIGPKSCAFPLAPVASPVFSIVILYIVLLILYQVQNS